MTASAVQSGTAPLSFEDWSSELERLGLQLHSVQQDNAALQAPFADVCSEAAQNPGTTVLLSGGASEASKYNFLGVHPWLTVRAKDDAVEVALFGRRSCIQADPLAVVGKLLEAFALEVSPAELPLHAGLLGYLSYDLKDSLEYLPRTSVNDLGLPYLFLAAPGALLAQNLETSEVRLLSPIFRGLDEAEQAVIENAKSSLASYCLTNRQDARGHRVHDLRQGMSQEEFVTSVKALRDHIAAGDAFQVNLSHRMAASFEGDPYSLFLDLFNDNPAPFYAFINAGDHSVLSTSPERFLKLQDGIVETRPIKGTRPRGASKQQDEAFLKELESSAKDDAELTMIADLLRNDLAKVCEPGSVRLEKHRYFESYKNVHHSISLVRGKVESQRSAVDLIRAAFPSGSVTGCPKLRAMELIDQYEPVRRHVYCGSTGYLSFHGTMDLSVAIRTAVLKDSNLYFSIGGGIVFDSDPKQEYEETLHKGKTFLGAVSMSRKERSRGHLWFDGRIVEAESSRISLLEPGVQYGIGLFETIRAVEGKPCLLDEHIARFETSWRELFKSGPPDITWRDVVSQVLQANDLRSGTACVKIQAIKKHSSEQTPFHLVVSAKEYIPRTVGSAKGLALRTYPEPRQSPLASHKTTNYMYYDMAKLWAGERGGDEALIRNPDESVSETNSANLLLVKGQSIIRPLSPHVLPGIMEQAVCDLLSDWNYDVVKRTVYAHDLIGADAVFLTNSLIGVMAAGSLDGVELAQNTPLLDRLATALFEA